MPGRPCTASTELDPLAERLTALGFITWNVEYRRIGEGGGVPNTLLDVGAAIDRLGGDGLPAGITDRVVLLGHSAGGHLSAWAASRTPATPGGAPLVRPRGAISLAGILGLTRGGDDPTLASTVSDFVGGSPAQVPDRYAVADPEKLVPASCPVWAVRADNDELVPRNQSVGYVAAAKAAGGHRDGGGGPRRPHLDRRALPALVPHHPEGDQRGDGPDQRLTSTALNRVCQLARPGHESGRRATVRLLT